MKLYIKNMVCPGTKKFVLLELKQLGFKNYSFELGSINFKQNLSLEEIEKLDYSLHKYGLEVIFRRTRLVSCICQEILFLVKNEITLKTSFSSYISNKVGYNYMYLNQCFTKETGFPIAEYYIEKRSEKLSLKKRIRSVVHDYRIN